MGVGHVGEKMTTRGGKTRVGWNTRRVEGQWTGKDINLPPHTHTHTKVILWHQGVHRKFAGLWHDHRGIYKL